MIPSIQSESFLERCNRIAGSGQKIPKVSSFHPIGGELETFTPILETMVETSSKLDMPESLTQQGVSKETMVETFWKPALKIVETFTPKNTPKSFQVSKSVIDDDSRQNAGKFEQLINSIAKDDRPYIRYHLAKWPDYLRLKILNQYLVIYQQAFDKCSNLNGKQNAGRKAGNIWIREEAKLCK
ncbi:MAG: hypothetical protein HOM14_15270 [Gammaproteobacteria bacterium]|jgi:hypothetical protein|nr:hypothetical protein [Gammaproteobacteria bacterium]MBT4196455.1 hypothetical protein [Gammaproteobacteria bacterium]MBT4448578.1 hypothetical protein [Gammaproteobacteria bacterium]MBT6456017.1 hypothetical protein [Gammaproteobacteria bacterium]MBT6552708.1 hypothetical protein [Gammaproteobacteria bacterium]